MNPVHCHCLLKLKYLITPQCVNKLHDQNIAVSMKLKMKNWPHMQITDPKSAKCQFAVVRMTLAWLNYLRGKSRVPLNTRTLTCNVFFPQSRKLTLFGCNAKYLNGRRKLNLTTSLCSTLFSYLSITHSLSLGDVDLKRREAVKRKIAEILEHAERLLSIQTPTQDHNT